MDMGRWLNENWQGSIEILREQSVIATFSITSPKFMTEGRQEISFDCFFFEDGTDRLPETSVGRSRFQNSEDLEPTTVLYRR